MKSLSTTGNGRAALRNSATLTAGAWNFGAMEPLRTALTIAGCCLLLAGTAQSTGTLRMIIDPGNDFSFIVDKKHRMQQREITLSEGLHDLTIWAPTRTMVDTAVFVIANKTSDLVVRLPLSPEYVQYRRELSRFETKRRWTRTAPIAALVGGLIWTGMAYAKVDDAQETLELDNTNYGINVDPASIDVLKDQTIPAHKDDLKKAQGTLYAATGFTVLSAAATWYIMRRTAKWDRPVFDDKEKVRFDGLAWVPGVGTGTFMAGFTIPLAR